jgi:hypothetical protein
MQPDVIINQTHKRSFETAMTKIKPDNFVFNGQSGLFRNRKLKILQKVRLQFGGLILPAL